MDGGPYAGDVATVRAILRGEEKPWHDLVERYADRILRTAYGWCQPGCERPGCPYRALKTKGILRYLRSPCDEIRDAFLFILEKIRFKALPAYQGRCSLDTFLYRVLHPVAAGGYGYGQLCADYLRHRIGRLRLPRLAAKLSPLHRAIFEALCRGWSRERVARQLGVTPEQVQEAEDQIRRLLINKGWRHFWYWLGFRNLHEVPLCPPAGEAAGDEDTAWEIAVPDGSPSPERRAGANELAGKLNEAIAELRAEDQALLRLLYGERLPVREVAQRLGCKPRAVYCRRDEVLRRLHRGLESSTGRCIAPLASFLRFLDQYLCEAPPSSWRNEAGQSLQTG